MQSLCGGSFINLENREKIEQMSLYSQRTCKRREATEGFVNAVESNHRRVQIIQLFL